MAHHTINVFFEAMRGNVVAMYHSEHSTDMGVTNAEVTAGAAAEAPGSATEAV